VLDRGPASRITQSVALRLLVFACLLYSQTETFLLHVHAIY